VYEGRRHLWQEYDIGLFLAAIVTSLLGLAMIASATHNTPDLADSAQRQAVFLAIAVVLSILMATLDYRLLTGAAVVFYLLGLAGLLLVDLMGSSQFGGQRWLALAGSKFQPSEFMKPCLVLALAQYLGSRQGKPWRFRYVLVTALLVFPPALLAYLQPDLSLAVEFLFVWALLLFLGGITAKQVILLALLAGLALPLVWVRLDPYMKARALHFLHPGSDSETSYIVNQALISIGSGSIWGKGYEAGSQSQLHFLRVRHTDFIFSVIGEELGFVGGVITLSLLAFISYRFFRIGQSTPDGPGRLLACGVGSLIALESIVHVGVNAGLLPVTGLPLPFISLGGSSLLVQFLSIGLAESVALRRRLARP
jgi:rod shape determining protein RodA